MMFLPRVFTFREAINQFLELIERSFWPAHFQDEVLTLLVENAPSVIAQLVSLDGIDPLCFRLLSVLSRYSRVSRIAEQKEILLTHILTDITRRIENSSEEDLSGTLVEVARLIEKFICPSQFDTLMDAFMSRAQKVEDADLSKSLLSLVSSIVRMVPSCILTPADQAACLHAIRNKSEDKTQAHVVVAGELLALSREQRGLKPCLSKGHYGGRNLRFKRLYFPFVEKQLGVIALIDEWNDSVVDEHLAVLCSLMGRRVKYAHSNDSPYDSRRFYESALTPWMYLIKEQRKVVYEKDSPVVKQIECSLSLLLTVVYCHARSDRASMAASRSRAQLLLDGLARIHESNSKQVRTMTCAIAVELLLVAGFLIDCYEGKATEKVRLVLSDKGKACFKAIGLRVIADPQLLALTIVGLVKMAVTFLDNGLLIDSDHLAHDSGSIGELINAHDLKAVTASISTVLRYCGEQDVVLDEPLSAKLDLYRYLGWWCGGELKAQAETGLVLNRRALLVLTDEDKVVGVYGLPSVQLTLFALQHLDALDLTLAEARALLLSLTRISVTNYRDALLPYPEADGLPALFDTVNFQACRAGLVSLVFLVIDGAINANPELAQSELAAIREEVSSVIDAADVEASTDQVKPSNFAAALLHHRTCKPTGLAGLFGDANKGSKRESLCKYSITRNFAGIHSLRVARENPDAFARHTKVVTAVQNCLDRFDRFCDSLVDSASVASGPTSITRNSTWWASAACEARDDEHDVVMVELAEMPKHEPSS